MMATAIIRMVRMIRTILMNTTRPTTTTTAGTLTSLRLNTATIKARTGTMMKRESF